MFLERAIRGGRHVEVQVVADADGTVWTLGVRDCSVQRRNQKVIEESASTALDGEQEQALRSHAAELVRAAGYVNAGTVEFLYEPKERLLSFLEVNTRLQVEHPVTEATTGTDIVKLQLHIAAGGTLADVADAAPPAFGHAIEARLTAEDPERGFAPAPGRIEHLALPAGPGIRVDTGVAAGDVIPPQFDSMIAKVIAWGRDRGEARARLSRALKQTATVIRGGTTNKAFLLDLLDRPDFVHGEVDTTWLDTMMADGYTPPRRLDVALLATAVEAYDAHVKRQQAPPVRLRRAREGPRSATRPGIRPMSARTGRPTGCGCPAAAPPATTWNWTGRRRWMSTSTAPARSSACSASATRPLPCSRSRRARTTWSRSTARCTGYPAAKLAWSAPRRRPWWWPSRSGPVTRSRRATSSRSSRA